MRKSKKIKIKSKKIPKYEIGGLVQEEQDSTGRDLVGKAGPWGALIAQTSRSITSGIESSIERDEFGRAINKSNAQIKGAIAQGIFNPSANLGALKDKNLSGGERAASMLLPGYYGYIKEKKRTEEGDKLAYDALQATNQSTAMNQPDYYKMGGIIEDNQINVEKNELEVDEKTGEVFKDFKGKLPHSQGGYTYSAESGRVIIRGKDADKYKKSDQFAKMSMIREHILSQKNNEQLTEEYKKGGKINFKSAQSYHDWLGYLHATGIAGKTPGNQKVYVRGKVHKVKHMGLGGSTDPNQTQFIQYDEMGNPITANSMYQTGRTISNLTQVPNPFGQSLVDMQGSKSFSTPQSGNTYSRSGSESGINWGNIGSQAATWAPVVYNTAMAFQKPIEEKPIYNPHEEEALRTLRNRRINMDPIKRDIFAQERVASAPLGESQGSYLSRRTQISANTQKALADAELKAQEINLGYQRDLAGGLDVFGQQRVGANRIAREQSLKNQYNQAQFLPKALEETSYIAQIKNRENKSIPMYAENLRSKFILDQMKKGMSEKQAKAQADEYYGLPNTNRYSFLD